jgi:hypothetical protein
MAEGMAGLDFQAQIQQHAGLTQELIDLIKEIDADPGEVCSICLENFSEGQQAKKLPNCGHQFHKNCIALWLLRSRICPFCKQEITETSVRSQS